MIALFHLIHDPKKLKLALGILRCVVQVEQHQVSVADGLSQVAVLLEEFLGDAAA